MSNDQPAKKQWNDLQTFTEEGSDLAVRVQASTDERPILSWQTGRLREGRFMPHHRNRYQTAKGVVSLEYVDFEVLARIAKRAQDFIHEQLQSRENAFQERRHLGNKPKVRGASPGKNPHEKFWDYEP